MHSKSDNMEFMICHNSHEVIEETFESFLNGYQIRLETSMRGSDFSLIVLIYFITNVITPNRGESYIDSPNWMKNKAAINLINKNDKCFLCCNPCIKLARN